MTKIKFEGWYFKLAAPEGAGTIAFIPEISTDEEGRQAGSLQVVFPDRAHYFTYDYPARMKKILYVVLGKSVFTDACISINITSENLSINGNVTFEDVGAKKFNVMGPLALFPMSCKHAILSMEQSLAGGLTINGDFIDFTGGRGYLEKDFGTSFPKNYLWTQCNDFIKTDREAVLFTRISAALAEIPIAAATLRSSSRVAPFTVRFAKPGEAWDKKAGFDVMGCYACIEHEGKKYKLASYLGARVEVMDKTVFRIRQGKLIFEGRRMDATDAEKDVPKGVRLKYPERAKMTGETTEFLECTMEYRLTQNEKEVFRLKSDRASFEYL